MRIVLLIIAWLVILSAALFGGELPPPYQSHDPNSCVYWTERLAEIAYWEKCRDEEVPEMERTEGFHAAVEYDITLRERIRAVMKQIERDSK